MNYKKFYTDKGIELIHRLIQSLVKVMYKTEKYPIKLGIVYGLNCSNDGQERIVNSKEELEGRIKGLMMLLGIRKIRVPYGAQELVFEI